jgi:membrane-associated phospholipid phosphatase
MRPNYAAWVGLFILAVLVTLAAKYYAYFPGDVGLTRFVQWIAPPPTGWAQWISSTAKFPLNLVLLGMTVGLSWKFARWRVALLALASFVGMWVLGLWLGPWVARPRPSPELVHVAGKLSGSSFPSIFALTYASTSGFLAVLFAQESSGTHRIWAVVICCVLLLIGWAARIVLGAHWPSDVIISYYLGLLWAAFLIRFFSYGFVTEKKAE